MQIYRIVTKLGVLLTLNLPVIKFSMEAASFSETSEQAYCAAQ